MRVSLVNNHANDEQLSIHRQCRKWMRTRPCRRGGAELQQPAPRSVSLPALNKPNSTPFMARQALPARAWALLCSCFGSTKATSFFPRDPHPARATSQHNARTATPIIRVRWYVTVTMRSPPLMFLDKPLTSPVLVREIPAQFRGHIIDGFSWPHPAKRHALPQRTLPCRTLTRSVAVMRGTCARSKEKCNTSGLSMRTAQIADKAHLYTYIFSRPRGQRKISAIF